jgi:16S rRNA (guanine527-N7)-methyltransferase
VPLLDGVPRETAEQLERYAALLTQENERQNLIASSTLPQIWTRHIADSLQLLEHAPTGWRRWVDIGSGGGLPGIVIAIASERHVTLVEPRRLRRAFLDQVAIELQLPNVTTYPSVVAAESQADVIRARAVAKLDDLFGIGQPAARAETTWILPKGRSADRELAEARNTWHGRFRLVASLTDAEAQIVIATDVRPKGRR